MDRLLDEVKVLMHERGYSIEDIKLVVDSFNNFISYVSRNGLENEFNEVIGSFRNNILRRMTSKKSASNIASVAEFNGTSPAASFVKSCVERRVQNVLQGFLKSSEVYYDMACNSDSIDVTRILTRMSLDGIDNDKSVELTAPATIISFSTELSLKTLYSIKNYDTIVRNIYSEVTRYESGSYPNEGLFNNRLKLIEIVSGDWKNIGISNSAQDTMNNVRDSYSNQDRPVNLPEDDRFANVKVNGHTLYKVFDNLPEEYRTMIKYQIATAFSRGDKKNFDDKVVGAIDYFLMISTIDTTLENMDSTKQMVINSNNFDRMRYLIDQLGSEELLFSMAFACSSYIVARNEVNGKSFSSIKNCDYTSKGLQFTEELNDLVSNNPDKKYLIDYIVNNRQLLGNAKNLSPKDLYVLIDMFSLDELNWMKDSCNVEDSCSFKEMMYYCVFFKRHLNDYEFRYTGEKYKNINRLFYTIKSTNNLAMLGSQIAQWFAEINIYSLTQEEFDALKIFDNEFIFNSLSYKDRVLYKKCSDRGIPFKIYYMSNVYTASINKYIDAQDIDVENFEEQVGNRVNGTYNNLLLVSDSKFNRMKENEELSELLSNEFGSLDNIPKFLLTVPFEDLKNILVYCNESGVSLKDWSRNLITSSCFFCKTSYVIKKIKESSHKITLRSPVQSLLSADLFGEMQVQRLASSSSGSIKLSDFNEFVEAIYNENTTCYDLNIENDSEKDIIDYLLNNGIDFMSASYLSKTYSREQLEQLIEYMDFKALPRELLGMILSGKLSLEDLILKNKLFQECGCRFDDIPIRYYTRHDINAEVFTELFRILDGIYKKENIPGCLLMKDTNSVQILINKLKQENINIYHFMSFMPSDSLHLYSNTDLYIYVYKTIKNLPINSGMVVKNFDLVIGDYSRMKYLLKLEEDNSTLLEASLYHELDSMIAIKSLCDEKSIRFMPELLYFDVGFLEQQIEYVVLLIDGMKTMGIDIDYEKASSLMINKGWTKKTSFSSIHTDIDTLNDVKKT